MIRLYVKLDKNFPNEIINRGAFRQTIAGTMEDSAKMFLAALRTATPVWDGSGGRAGGTLQRGWEMITRSKFGYSFINQTSYADIVDTGRFRGIGRKPPIRTIAGPKYPGGHGIFSTQAPEGITWPYFNEEGSEADWVNQVINKFFDKYWNQYSSVI